MSDSVQEEDNLLQELPSESEDPFEMLSHLDDLDKYVLRLYVADSSPKSVRAIQKLQQICDRYLEGRYELEVIDIYQEPERLEEDQIFAIPTLIKEIPPPLLRLIGDMTDTEKLIICLDL